MHTTLPTSSSDLVGSVVYRAGAREYVRAHPFWEYHKSDSVPSPLKGALRSSNSWQYSVTNTRGSRDITIIGFYLAVNSDLSSYSTNMVGIIISTVFLRWSSVPGTWSRWTFPGTISQDNSSSRTTLGQLSGVNLSWWCPMLGWYFCTCVDTYLISSYANRFVRYSRFLYRRLQYVPGDCPGMYVSRDSGSVRSYIFGNHIYSVRIIIRIAPDWNMRYFDSHIFGTNHIT